MNFKWSIEDPDYYIGNPIGNQNCVLTKDNYFVYLKVNKHATQGKGQIAGPGGHPEPSVYFKRIERSI